MLYAALATDYDGTIAQDGIVPAATVEKLRWLKERGKALILVTGRELPELQQLFPEIGLCDAVVAENGALLFLPAEGTVQALADPPPPVFVAALRARNVTPLSIGSSIVATWSPNEQLVLDLVHEHGLEWQIIFNKGAVMCLPPGINKASGLAHALDHMGLSALNVIGVGDAENDHAFLSACGYSVAVANALDAVKQAADRVTAADHGAGVVELIDAWLGGEDFGAGMRRHGAVLAEDGAGPVVLHPARHAVLIAGASGGGKSSLATALIERVQQTGAQVLIVDPEGDYGALPNLAQLGTADRPPALDEVGALLEQPHASLAVGLLAVPPAERPGFLADLFGAIVELRATRGRPHWLLIDEAHHFLPAEMGAPAVPLPAALPGSILVTVEPKALAPPALALANLVIVVGPEAGEAIGAFCAARGLDPPRLPPPPEEGEIWVWELDGPPPRTVTAPEPTADHQRHVRKYAEGRLAADKSFFFRGPEGKLNLRAHNLVTFMELAEGVDDETWLHHLKRGDYSRWLGEEIDDEDLAEEIAAIEAEPEPDAAESRQRIRAAIQRRYTAPA